MSKNLKITNPMKVITGPNTRWSYANVNVINLTSWQKSRNLLK